ncbi:MAG: hypothetical protein ACLQMO_02450 [Acidobacteriaceae bacterium]
MKPQQTPKRLVPVGFADVTVGGEIGRRIDITVRNNLLALNVDRDFLSRVQNELNIYSQLLWAAQETSRTPKG